MKPFARWYFDFVSPFSYLQLAKALEWRSRLDIAPVPIAFGAVLKHHGQLGPAEIPGKREFTIVSCSGRLSKSVRRCVSRHSIRLTHLLHFGCASLRERLGKRLR